MLFHPQTKTQADSFATSPSHAVGIRGEEGAGKGMTARYLASKILKTDASKLTAHPYVYTADVKEIKTGIEEVRRLHDFLKLRVPGNDDIKRAVILENIDYLRHEAQNALLKTLEEPPTDTVIITTFSRRNRVLPTIHSRVQQIIIKPVELAHVQADLTEEFSSDEINRAYSMSGGQAGLFAAILTGEEEHELAIAIAAARRIIEMPRHRRLAAVDKIAKDKNAQPALLLEGMYRLLYAGYQNALQVSDTSADNLKTYVKRLGLIEQSIKDLHENVQAKLVLSRLFLEL